MSIIVGASAALRGLDVGPRSTSVGASGAEVCEKLLRGAGVSTAVASRSSCWGRSGGTPLWPGSGNPFGRLDIAAQLIVEYITVPCRGERCFSRRPGYANELAWACGYSSPGPRPRAGLKECAGRRPRTTDPHPTPQGSLLALLSLAAFSDILPPRCVPGPRDGLRGVRIGR